MKNNSKTIIINMLLALFLLITACSEDKKESQSSKQVQPAEVSKKIEKKIEAAPSTTQQAVAEKESDKNGNAATAETNLTEKEIKPVDSAHMSVIPQNKTGEIQPPADVSDKKNETESQSLPVKTDEKIAQGASAVTVTNKNYDASGKVNPFMPFYSDESEKKTDDSSSKKIKKREPLTPLEKIDIAQLKLTAITKTSTGNIALVEEANGKGYILNDGTYIGLNSGKVINILSDKVIIEEETENIFGKVSIQERELKLQKPTGE